MRQRTLILTIIFLFLALSSAVLFILSPWEFSSFSYLNTTTYHDGAAPDRAAEAPHKTMSKIVQGMGDLDSDQVIENLPPSEDELLRIKGRVFGKGLDPLIDFHVKRALQTMPHIWNKEREKPVWMEADAVLAGNGSFELKIPRHEGGETLLQISHDDYIPHETRLNGTVKGCDGFYHLDDIHLISAFRISGQVKDIYGAVVPGCAVSAPGMPWLEWDAHANQDQAVTDEKGLFSLCVKEREMMRVTACCDDIGAGWSEHVQPGVGKDHPFVKIVLDSCRPIAGRIVHRNGTPVAGVRLQVMSHITLHHYEIVRKCATDAQGRFRFFPLPDTGYEVSVCNIGLPHNVSNMATLESFVIADHVRPGTENLFFYYPGTSGLVVHLKDKSGKPIDEEPKIYFAQAFKNSVKGKLSRWKSCFDSSGEIQNPEPGTFVYGNLQPGIMDVMLSVEGKGKCRCADVTIPPPPEMAEVTATLKPRPSIEGLVLHANGVPASGIMVNRETNRATGRNGYKFPISFTHEGIRVRNDRYKQDRAITDMAGRFSFHDLWPGVHHLYFSVDGHEVFKKTNIDLSKTEQGVDLTITLPGLNGSLKGTVSNGTGAAIPRAVVMAWNGDDLFLVTRCDPQGRYRFENLPEGRYIVDARVKSSLALQHSYGHKREVPEENRSLNHPECYHVFLSNDETTTLNLFIEDPWGSRIAGNVTTSTGRFPKDLQFYLQQIDKKGEEIWTPKPMVTDLFIHQTYRSDDVESNTSFLFNDLPAGRYQLSVHWEDQLDYDRSYLLGDFELGICATKHLDVLLPFTTMEGDVTDQATGLPVEGATVALMQGNEWEYSYTETDEAGHFKGVDLAAGTFPLLVEHHDYAPYFIPAFTLSTNERKSGLRIQLKRGCTVTGVVKIKEVACDCYWDLRIHPVMPFNEMTGELDDWIDLDGSYTLQRLPPGPTTIQIFNEEQLVQETEITLPLPEETELNFEVCLPKK